jgi:hypothetical protein
MLIEKSKYQVGDIISLKLISGDEIIGKLVEQTSTGYELNRPCVVITTPDGIGVLQAMFGLDPDRDNLTYNDQHIITSCPSHDRLKEHYVKVLEEGEETDSFIQTTNITSE